MEFYLNYKQWTNLLFTCLLNRIIGKQFCNINNLRLKVVYHGPSNFEDEWLSHESAMMADFPDHTTKLTFP